MAEIWPTEGLAAPPKNDNQMAKTRKCEKMQKKVGFFKNEGLTHGVGEKYFYRGSAWSMRIFRLYIQKTAPLTFDGQMQKNKISVTFGRFGAFPDLWRHTYRKFLSVIIDLAYRSNETFLL